MAGERASHVVTVGAPLLFFPWTSPCPWAMFLMVLFLLFCGWKGKVEMMLLLVVVMMIMMMMIMMMVMMMMMMMMMVYEALSISFKHEDTYHFKPST